MVARNGVGYVIVKEAVLRREGQVVEFHAARH
jgi:hypothetical protein